jgi:hypothetical protein
MGTGFTPQSAEATAEMIAGQQAQAASEQARQAQAAAQDSGQQAQGQQSGQQPGQQGQGQSPASQQADQTPGQPDSQSQAEGMSDDPNRQGGGTKQSGVHGDSAADATVGQPPVENEPWFAKLPPETQESIRTKARRPAPRGYEDKLRRYFDSIGQ